MKSLLTLAGIFAAAVSFAAVQVSEMPGAVFLKNDHLEAVVTAKGGKLASLRDVAAKMEYGHGYSLQALKAGKLGPADGFAKSRVWETTSDRTLFTSDFDLRVVRKTDKEVVVEASYRAMSGLIKGVDIIHLCVMAKAASISVNSSTLMLPTPLFRRGTTMRPSSRTAWQKKTPSACLLRAVKVLSALRCRKLRRFTI